MIDSPYFPSDENGDVLRYMANQGDNLSVPRAIDFSVVMPDEERARLLSATFATQGYIVRVNLANTVPEFPWDVVVVKFMAPSHREISRFEEELGRSAQALGGRNDGWGCFEQFS